MNWFNYYGLIVIAIILIPNIISAVVDKGSIANKYNNKAILVLEQIGRYGCMAFMVFNIPHTYFNFWLDSGLIVYLIVNGTLLALYILGWIIFRKGHGAVKMLWLSVVPTMLFLLSGIMLLSIPLMFFSIIFGIGHITISYNNRELR